MTQITDNPFKYTNTNKRYHTFDYHMKEAFGGKVAKITLDAGLSCPNRDGRCGTGGCIFCRGRSSSSTEGPLWEQYLEGKKTADRKWNCIGYIPYLQAGSNTYASGEILHKIYNEAASLPGSVMLCIATRADCLQDYAIEEIAAVSERLPVIVELGLQSTSDRTAGLINRGYSYGDFLKGYDKVRSLKGDVRVGVHIINGLPGECEEDMIRTAADVASIRPDYLKIHLMLVLKGTELEKMYLENKYVPMEKEAYVKAVCDQLELMPPETVIERITGDAVIEDLAAPEYSRRKTEISNMIDKELFKRNSWQGKSEKNAILK